MGYIYIFCVRAEQHNQKINTQICAASGNHVEGNNLVRTLISFYSSLVMTLLLMFFNPSGLSQHVHYSNPPDSYLSTISITFSGLILFNGNMFLVVGRSS
jgi:hypothetical protein